MVNNPETSIDRTAIANQVEYQTKHVAFSLV